MKNFYRKLCLPFLVWLFATANLNGQTTNVTFKPNAVNGNDAFVENVDGCLPGYPYDSYDDTNFGNNNTLRTIAWTFNQQSGCGTTTGSTGSARSYIRFDELNSLPSNAVINSATLKLYGVSQSDIPGEYGNTTNNSPYKENSIKIGLVQSSWNEQSITWNNKPGIDFSAGITHPVSTLQFNETISIDITSLAQFQVSSGINNGYGIQLITESRYRSRYWASSDHQLASKHPELIISYTLPCDANFTYCYNTEDMKFTFTPNSGNGINYNWNFGNGSNITTSGPASIPVSYSQPGTYKVCLTVEAFGIGKCSNCIEICVTSSQVEDTAQPKNQYKNNNASSGSVTIENLYPNPASNHFTLEIKAKKAGNGKLLLYDITGKKVGEFSMEVIEGIQSIRHDFSNLGKGMYLCTIVIDGQRANKTFIID